MLGYPMPKSKIIRTYNSDELDKLAISQFFSTDEESLQILRSHLLIERILISYVQRKVSNPKALAKANMNFRQILALAEALDSNDEHEWLWPCISKLNELRNEIAHEIQGKHYFSKLHAFLDSTQPWIHVDNIKEDERFVFRLMILCKVSSNFLGKSKPNHALAADS